jgi:thiol-disulfide isomerase/thioredoxin
MRRTLLIAGVLFALVLVGALVYFFAIKKGVFFEEKKEGLLQAPDFTLPDASGNMVSLEDIKGEVVIINFWASWSPYAKDELSALVTLKKEFGSDIAIVGLNRDANPREGQVYLAGLGLGEEMVFVYDVDDTYYKKVSAFAMPETLFLNEDGKVVAQIHGPMRLEEMRAQVEAILQ